VLTLLENPSLAVGGFSSNIFSFFTAVFHTPRAQGETAVNNWVAGRRGRYYDEFRIVFRPGDAQVNELNREDRSCGRSILRASRLLVESRPGFYCQGGKYAKRTRGKFGLVRVCGAGLIRLTKSN